MGWNVVSKSFLYFLQKNWWVRMMCGYGGSKWCDFIFCNFLRFIIFRIFCMYVLFFELRKNVIGDELVCRTDRSKLFVDMCGRLFEKKLVGWNGMDRISVSFWDSFLWRNKGSLFHFSHSFIDYYLFVFVLWENVRFSDRKNVWFSIGENVTFHVSFGGKHFVF